MADFNAPDPPPPQPTDPQNFPSPLKTSGIGSASDSTPTPPTTPPAPPPQDLNSQTTSGIEITDEPGVLEALLSGIKKSLDNLPEPIRFLVVKIFEIQLARQIDLLIDNLPPFIKQHISPFIKHIIDLIRHFMR